MTRAVGSVAPAIVLAQHHAHANARAIRLDVLIASPCGGVRVRPPRRDVLSMSPSTSIRPIARNEARGSRVDDPAGRRCNPS
jgi:hypothetical protein